jgi:hypothetical protein
MAGVGAFNNQKKVRKAELISPPNVLKKKMGTGGIDEMSLIRAQEALEKDTTDFKPIAIELIKLLEEGIEAAKNGSAPLEPTIEMMIYPAMQLKAQGGMFRYPLITLIGDILINFLETVTEINKDMLDIVTAHKMAISVVIAMNITGDSDKKGQELRESLLGACTRYYKTREKTPAK